MPAGGQVTLGFHLVGLGSCRDMRSGSLPVPEAMWKHDGGRVMLTLSGHWMSKSGAPKVEGYEKGDWPDLFMTGNLGDYDSRLPAYLLLDEPGAGLDPLSSQRLDELILKSRDSLGSTFVIVTHELASIFSIANHSVFLDAGTRTQGATGDPKQLRDHSDNQAVRLFFNRGQPSLTVQNS